ncbi:hypothetical protein pdam_00007243 [Pocillopora damicornis]|uniref:Uncharacterized protein n=1 Tax=Pocillopora damicornis TaxID=46731 RepID=A0A3M6UMX4_POCDA|nr:hypothetical protein pdam_00007243 [Pocillopora damicornis]
MNFDPLNPKALVLQNNFKTVVGTWSPRLNPLTPMSDQDRVSPYNINIMSTSLVMRITKNFGIIS